jgi:hypothetical protein
MDIDEATPLETRDLQLLTRAWVAERAAPELLPWPEDVMDRVLGRIARQVRCCSPTSELGVTGSGGISDGRWRVKDGRGGWNMENEELR